MTELNYIKKILNEVEIEWKNLWEVTYWDKKFKAVESYKQPKTIKYKYLTVKEIEELIIDNGDIKILTTNISDLWTTEEKVKDYIAKGEVVVIPGGGNPVIQYYKGKFVTSDNRIATSRDIYYLDNKYLYYFLSTQIKKIGSFYRGAGIKHPDMSQILDLKIPIPPIKVQKEIVYILDTIAKLTTKLATKLTLELTEREKQFKYYRNNLFTLIKNSKKE